MKKIFLILVVFLGVAGMYAQSVDDVIERGIALHNRAYTEDETTVLKCQKTLEPFVETNMIARGYYGSALTIQASFYAEVKPYQALSLLDEGSYYMDSAVSSDPDNYELRIIRLSNGIEVSRSSPVKRYDVIADDVRWFEEHPLPDSQEERAVIFYNIGLFYLDGGFIEEALDALDACIATGVDTVSVKNARDVLRSYEE